jgi:hypothetical protein
MVRNTAIERHLRAALCAALAACGACGDPPAGDAGLDAGDADADANGDAGTRPPAACHLLEPPGATTVDVSQCLDSSCQRPRIDLAADGEAFLVAYSKNLRWWNSDVHARRVDEAGAALGEVLPISALVRSAFSRESGVKGASEPVAAIAWPPGWLVVWEDRLAVHPLVAGSSRRPDGAPTWPGAEFLDIARRPWTWVGAVMLAPLDCHHQLRIDHEECRPHAQNGEESPRRPSQATQPDVAAMDGGAVMTWLGSESWPGIRIAWIDPARVASDVGPSAWGPRDIEVAAAPEAYDRPAVAVGDETILVVWSSMSEVEGAGAWGPDIWARLVRRDLASCFGRCTVGGEVPVERAAYESSAPDVAWIGDAYLVVWQDYRAGNFEIQSTRVLEGPQASVAAESLANLSESPGPSLAPSVATAGGVVYVAWQEGPAPWEVEGSYDVLFSRSTDGGRTWEEPLLVAADVGQWPEPRVAVAGDTVGVAWVADADADFAVRFASLRCEP